MMRFAKILLIVLLCAPIVAIGVIALSLLRGFYVKNRYEVQAISMEWIDPMEPGLSGCIDFRRNIQPAKLQGLGIVLVLDLKLVSDSTKGTHKIWGHFAPGGDGPKDSLLTVNFLQKDLAGSMLDTQADQHLLDVGIPCYNDITQQWSPRQAPADYGWGEFASISSLEAFRHQFNEGLFDAIPRSAWLDSTKVAFFLWPDSALTASISTGQQLGMKMRTQKGREFVTWLALAHRPKLE